MKTSEEYIEDVIYHSELSIIKEKYNEPHRYYHNWDHVLDLMNKAIEQNIVSTDLIIAIVYHDVVYDPRRNDNEERSLDFYNFSEHNKIVRDAILNTKEHLVTDNEISNQLNSLDMSVLHGDFKTFMEYEHKIFKEFQYVDYDTYKEKRVEFLKTVEGINPSFIEYVENRKPNIGVYAGSFNPFHKGHLDILKKAEQMFDKVIIARGYNPNKDNALVDLPSFLKNYQVEMYDGLLTDFIDSLGYEVTLIRGLRNSTDFEYEKLQYRFLKDLKPDIKVINIFSEPEFEHISSSAIRMLDKYNKGNIYKV